MNRNYLIAGIIIFLGVFMCVFVSAAENYTATTIVEANILVGTSGNGTGAEVSIQVPDRIYLGNVSVGGVSDEIKVQLNNTGTRNISITPQLVDSNNEIFSNLYFKRILSEPLYKIGEYTHYIKKPSTGSVRTSYCYMQLDLRNFNGDIEEDLFGETTQVQFIALSTE